MLKEKGIDHAYVIPEKPGHCWMEEKLKKKEREKENKAIEKEAEKAKNDKETKEIKETDGNGKETEEKSEEKKKEVE